MSLAIEDLPEDMLRDMRDGQVKELKVLNRMVSTMGQPPVVNVQPAQITVQPAPVVVKSPRKISGEVTSRTEDGRIKTFTLTITE